MTASNETSHRSSVRCLFAAIVCIAMASMASAAVPTFEQVRAAHRPSERLLLDRDGEVLQRIRIDDKVRQGAWVELDAISPALIDAVLASEDQRFFEHGGVDLRAAGAALITNLRAGAIVRGGSSITMQVAALLDPSLARQSGGRSLDQKLAQAQAGWALEARWSKAQILETYLNGIFYRGELKGIAAASEGLFSKAPHGLDRNESALLAALIRAPQAPRAVIERRACELLIRMSGRPDATPGNECGALAFLLDRFGSIGRLRDDRESIAPHLGKYVPVGAGRSSLVRDIQIAAREAIARHLPQLSRRNAHDAAVVVLDNATGEVLAYVGSSGRLSEAGEVDAARAPRQAGSTLKPFIYGLGIDRRLFTAATLLDDSPFSVDVGGGAYTPQNYAHEYVGPVSVRTALASSLNVPAIRALTLVGVDATHALLKRADLGTLHEDPDHYGFSLALGSADVTLLDLTNAYRAFAQGGVVSALRFTPLRSAAQKVASTRILSPGSAWIVADMLADRGARYVTFGFDNPLALSHWSAVKTGTSKDMRDNWAIGFNARVTVGVWVGNASGASMHGVSGISGAGPIWADVMEAAAARWGAGPAPLPPATLVRRMISLRNGDGGLEPRRGEWFLRGTEPMGDAVAARDTPEVGARITSPTDGAIIALDPDIAMAHQFVPLTSGDDAVASCWQVNEESLGCGNGAQRWHPQPGTFIVRLLDAAGHEHDRVNLVVRGNANR